MRKFILVCMVLCGFFLYTSARVPGIQDEPKITLTAKNITLTRLFEIVYEQTKLQVFYSNSLLNDKQTISVDYKQKLVGEIREAVLKGKPLTWSNSGDGYIRIAKKASKRKI